ncbi:hypothetical protein BDV93DRAFT_3597 [Ceratobasidium sp. AG-I]|nr:hypothetical protein BDV93DRAFT_3597 [Ceratobasidium sp. AG-I]
MNGTQSGTALQLPKDTQLRSVVLSYLLHHGHKDTVRALAKEIAHREAAESIERCPLWEKSAKHTDVDSDMQSVGNEAPTLDHAQLESPSIEKQAPAPGGTAPPEDMSALGASASGVPENVLLDVAVRRTIRHKILSGNIDEAIDLITHHFPTFLPVTPPAACSQPPLTDPKADSHDSSLLKTSLSSSAPPASPPSRASTPVTLAPEPTTASEKAAQKAETSVAHTSEAGSPNHVTVEELQTPDRISRHSNVSSLGRSVDPAYILLNLRVQQFVEAIRTVPLRFEEQSEGLPAQDRGSSDVDMHAPDQELGEGNHGKDQRKRHFELASQLYQSVRRLPDPKVREVYAMEVEQVCSLMLSSTPEATLAAPYLSMKRREALADQVNSAMLWHAGESPAPCLQIWAQTTRVVWDQIIGLRVSLPRVADTPPDVKMYSKYVARNSEAEEPKRKRQSPSTLRLWLRLEFERLGFS